MFKDVILFFSFTEGSGPPTLYRKKEIEGKYLPSYAINIEFVVKKGSFLLVRHDNYGPLAEINQ